jgi:signal transduction histidine kinase/ActR/RegA family two-component response regulator/HPt (histidine-containing phosphotransfer) domain-containing protein
VAWLFRRLTIRAKLTVVAMLASGAAILVASAAFGVYDLLAFRRSIVDDLSTHAAIIAENAAVSLSAGEDETVAATLTALRQAEEVQVVSVFRADGLAFATYVREPAYRGTVPKVPGPDGARFGDGCVEVYRPVMLGGRRVGTIYIRCGLGALQERLKRHGIVLLAVVISSSAVALFLVYRLQRVISGPMLHLARTAKTLSTEKNYSIRAGKISDDEVGFLTDCFNEMLEQVQLRDAELKAHRNHLEEQVAARTAELTERSEELKRLNAELVQQKDRAEAASRAKSAFLANMSHEIRTPMTAIVGYADMMLEPAQTSAERQDCLQTVRRNARHLLELINDILDISKIEAGKMSVERIACDPAQLACDVVSLMRPRAVEKGLSLRLDFEGVIPQRIRSDPLRFKQVLMNLVANAVKFTERGGVSVRCCYLAGEAGAGAGGAGANGAGKSGTFRMYITDTGIGMTPDQLARLFQAFTQADESMSRRFGGTGLGLTISKRLAKLLDGDIGVRSEPGVGTTFTIDVATGPLDGVKMLEGLTEATLMPSPHKVAPSDGRLRGRILYAEDGPDNQRLVCAHLRRAGATVAIADNGRIAVQMTETQKFDLILMDMQMPEMDGYAATSELRQRGMTLPIIALTAHAMAEDRAKCISAGCTDYLTKPIDRDVLIQTVADYLSKAQQHDAQAKTQRAPVPPPASRSAAQVVPTPALVRKPAPERRLRSTYADDDAMREVLEQFVAELPGHVRKLTHLMESERLEDLRRLTHQLKGAGGGYGFAGITEYAARAEKGIKTQATIDQVRADVNELVGLIRSVEGYDRARESASIAAAA